MIRLTVKLIYEFTRINPLSFRVITSFYQFCHLTLWNGSALVRSCHSNIFCGGFSLLDQSHTWQCRLCKSRIENKHRLSTSQLRIYHTCLQVVTTVSSWLVVFQCCFNCCSSKWMWLVKTCFSSIMKRLLQICHLIKEVLHCSRSEWNASNHWFSVFKCSRVRM